MKLRFFLVALAFGCGAPETEQVDTAFSAVAGSRDVTHYSIDHWTFVVGSVPNDGNLPGAQVEYSIRTSRSERATTYFARVQAGTVLEIGTSIDGIDRFGDPPPDWTGECYDSCLPRVRLVSFARRFVGYTLDGQLNQEIELTAANGYRASIAIPSSARGSLSYWFRFQDWNGRSFWDSLSGRNYRVEIVPANVATLAFGPSGAPILSGRLVRGGGVRIEYDLTRLTNAPLPSGRPAQHLSRLEAGITFDRMATSQWSTMLGDATPGSSPDIPGLTRNGWSYFGDQVAISPLFAIPTNASSVAVWAYAEAIDIDASPVTRPGIFDLQAGLTFSRPSGRLRIDELFDFPAVDAGLVRVALQVDNATTRWGENVFAVGNIDALGRWDWRRGVALSPTSYPSWTGSVDLPDGGTVEIKFVKVDQQGNVTWEAGSNRVLSVSGASPSYRGRWR